MKWNNYYKAFSVAGHILDYKSTQAFFLLRSLNKECNTIIKNNLRNSKHSPYVTNLCLSLAINILDGIYFW